MNEENISTVDQYFSRDHLLDVKSCWCDCITVLLVWTEWCGLHGVDCMMLTLHGVDCITVVWCFVDCMVWPG